MASGEDRQGLLTQTEILRQRCVADAGAKGEKRLKPQEDSARRHGSTRTTERVEQATGDELLHESSISAVAGPDGALGGQKFVATG